MGRIMKDSGIEWIGEIPEKWNIVRVKNKYKSHKDVVGENADNFERLALTLGGVIKRSKEDSTGLQPEAFNGYQILKQNDLVFKLIDLANVSTSRVGYSPYTGIVSPAYICLTPKEEPESHYGEYYFLSMWQREVFNHMGDDGVRSSLNSTDLLNTPYPDISLSEQKRIAEFLDAKCAEIDNVISKTEATIEEYKKLKQSVITEAVTKGIRGDRPMKPSGIEWIGDIPEEWERYSLKQLVTTPITDGTHMTPEYSDDVNGSPFLSSKDVSSGCINWNSIKYITKELHEELYKNVAPRRDDILLAKNGTTGIAAIVDTDKVFDIYVTLALIRVNKTKALPRYILYCINSLVCKRQFDEHLLGIGVPNLHLGIINNTKIYIPAVFEQEEIVTHLDSKCSEIDKLIDSKQKLLEELQQYKKSLIYEYVTGKKEVQ